MIDSLRTWYNGQFTAEKYEAYKHLVANMAGEAPLFRLAETPVFVPADFKNKLLRACDDLIEYITKPSFILESEKSIPAHLHFPNDTNYCPLMVFDFGVCKNEAGELIPQLIEMQGFPSLYGFQIMQAEACRENYAIPQHLDTYLGTNMYDHISELKSILIGDADPAEVILLDYKPEDQKTKIDFAATKKILGIEPVCVTKLRQEGRQVYYLKDGKKQKVSRIYNRLIFDEFFDLKIDSIDLRQDLDVLWLPHPNWFCRISKFTLPFIKSEFVPETHFVSDLKSIPDKLENYVLKPLYSYAGMGVKIDVTKEDLTSISDPDQWILQKKVNYHAAIITPNVPAKVEIRLMATWNKKDAKPRIVHNLARISKGKMIGVRYNADFDWVGSSLCFFEK